MILVHQPGMFTTVQDLGREGFGPMGVSPSGAADPIALRLGNRLVGNPEGAAALEMTLLGGTFEFDQDCVIAIPRWGEDWAAREVRAGETVRVGPIPIGSRCYLCVRGGIDVPLVLGSASTHILSGMGGLDGRALVKGDTLRIGPSMPGFRLRRLKPDVGIRLAPRKALRITPASQWSWFSEASQRSFLESPYRVTDESNRMGLRLEGAALESHGRGQMVTEGVPLGAIQIPAGGQPIILFVEQQTTGGYPKIANIIAADLSSVGQLRPRDEIRFELVSMETARRSIREQERLLRSEDLFL